MPPGRRRDLEPSPPGGRPAIGLRALVAAAAVTAAGSVVAARRTGCAGCAFGDGAAYCAMADGHPGAPPFCRRVLVPALVRGLRATVPRLRQPPLRAFAVLAVASVPATAAVTGLLTARVARECGAEEVTARLAGALTAALVPAMPHAAHLAVQVPVFNDGPAAALGGAWLLLVTGPTTGRTATGPATATGPTTAGPATATRPATATGPATAGAAAAAAPLLAALCVLTREQWAAVVVAVLLAQRPARGQLLAHLAAVGAALAVVAGQPAGPGSEVYPPGLALRRLASRTGAAEIGWALSFVPGALPVLLPGALRRLGRPDGHRSTVGAALATVAVQSGLALVGGSDTPRLLHGALPPLLAAVVGSAAARGDRRLGAVLAVTVAGWRPLAQPGGSTADYEEFFLPYMQGALRRRVAADLLHRALALGAVGAARAVSALGSRGPRRRVA